MQWTAMIQIRAFKDRLSWIKTWNLSDPTSHTYSGPLKDSKINPEHENRHTLSVVIILWRWYLRHRISDASLIRCDFSRKTNTVDGQWGHQRWPSWLRLMFTAHWCANVAPTVQHLAAQQNCSWLNNSLRCTSHLCFTLLLLNKRCRHFPLLKK